MKRPKRSIISWLLAVIYLPVFGLSLVFFDIAARILNLFSSKSIPGFMRVLNAWMLTIMKINGTKIVIKNKPPIDHSIPVLFVSNHQSLMDIPLIYCLYPELDAKFIAKKELSRFIPFVSYMLRSGNHAIIDRTSRSQAMSEIKRLCERVEESKKGIMIFPEGTRAREGKLKQFKLGGIRQIASYFPEIQIVPLAIDGSWRYSYFKLLPVPFGETITVNVGEPFIYDGETKIIEQQVHELLEDIRNG